MITLDDPEKQNIVDRVFAHGQGHVFRFWDELDAGARDALLAQLGAVDFALLDPLIEKFVTNPVEETRPAELVPSPAIPVPRTEAERNRYRAAVAAGEEALRRGEVCAFLVAGGQGSRLGFDGPKGIFRIGPLSDKMLFQIHAEKIIALREKYRSPIRWYILTSETNDAETREVFAREGFFGLPESDVVFFTQGMIPAVDGQGRLVLDLKHHVFENPNGTGGALLALYERGATADMKRHGVRYIFYFQVDNPIVQMLDPAYVGYHILEDSEMSMKVVDKACPEEKVGIVCIADGENRLIEYSDFPPELMTATEADGRLRFRAGSIAIHVLNRDFVERICEGGFKIQFHRAEKALPTLDAAGNPVAPTGKNGIKFESFVFDAIPLAKKIMNMETPREDDFAPVKNAEGVDSPASARQLMTNMFGRWCEKAGIDIPRDPEGDVKGVIEISPLYALTEDDFVARVDTNLKFTGELYLE